MDKPIFYEGQQVGCLMFGEGVIKKMDSSYIHVKTTDSIRTFYKNGKYMNVARHTLYPIEQYRAIIANLPAPHPEAWQPKPGEWCRFWNDNAEFFVVGKFDKIDKSGTRPYSIFGSDFWYMYCAPFTGELPEHLKEVHP